MDNQERIMRSIASSLQELARASIQINNQLAEIGRLLTPPAEEAESPLPKEQS